MTDRYGDRAAPRGTPDRHADPAAPRVPTRRIDCADQPCPGTLEALGRGGAVPPAPEEREPLRLAG